MKSDDSSTADLSCRLPGVELQNCRIWYGAAPNVVNTFCKEYDWTGKKVYAFATSGGSGTGKTAERLQPYVKGGVVSGAKLVHDARDLIEWTKSI